MVDVLDFNKRAWNRMVSAKNEWTIPVSEGEIEEARQGRPRIILTPIKPVPLSWLGSLQGRRVLGLASGGGQQGPLLAAAGADVTIVDLSPLQLEQDRVTAAKYGLKLRTIETSACDLSMIPDRSIQLIVNPVSNCFFPNLEAVWRECARVLEPGGHLVWGFNNPINFLFDCDEALKGNFVLKYSQPYSDETCLTAEERERCMGADSPYEFGHSWQLQIGDLLRNGFVLEDLFEDIWHKDQGLNKHFPLFIAAKARRL